MLIRDKSSLKKYGAFLIGGKVDGIFTGTVSLVAPPMFCYAKQHGQSRVVQTLGAGRNGLYLFSAPPPFLSDTSTGI